ncbi:signal peptide peptidase (plasmid) [Legionella adelaidensis]|uniref:Signal peptide peptidase n=1 Tax=Legionella adelaidensis TaxID=45056 RepID=A0A0W0R367_9GAMM|nr:S49 family peptidase [Legionella adelaidensis]KTC65509.1 signal peptide peptidase [Legionella adelaidensis]VEH84670.1 signal peptide peptidase [Legionella adelaidensis]
MNNNSPAENESQLLLNKIILEYMRDQKRRRFWRWVIRVIIFLFILWILYSILAKQTDTKETKTTPHVGVIDLKGTIFDDQSANADNLMKSMEKAYKNNNMKAMILRIDSPGGSPVQADYMYNTVRYFRKKYPDIKVYAVCVDACASAAYYVAAAADEIYASPSSLVGSIGVLYNGFGFVDTLQKLGVTRRLYTSGENKGFMDPFSQVTPDQEKLLKQMLNIIHQQFIDKVKEGRGNRLIIGPETFSGLFWTGVQAKQLGLIDGFASPGQLAREIIKVEKMVDYTYKENVIDRLAKNIGSAMMDKLPTALGLREGFK